MITSSKGLGPEKDYAGEGQQHLQKTDPSSRQRGHPKNTSLKLSKSNKYLVMRPTWDSTPRLNQLTDRQLLCYFDFDFDVLYFSYHRPILSTTDQQYPQLTDVTTN
jgi:hypothetical protein